MPCQMCGGMPNSYLHLRESSAHHDYVEADTTRPSSYWAHLIPTYMEMEDAVRAMDHSNLAPHFQKTINQMRQALIAAMGM